MYTFRAMNTTFGTVGLNLASHEQTEQLIHTFEKKLSRFQSTSELTALNQAAGQPHRVSPLLYGLLSLAHTYHQETDGLFNPYLGDVLCELGYDKSFEILPAYAQSFSFPQSPQPACLHKSPLVLDASEQTAVLRAGVQVDLGGIAKGWSADEARRRLLASGISSGLIDAGGDIAVWGTNEGEPWGISIANPFHVEEDVAVLWLHRDAGIATSSSIKRSWQLTDGTRVHHIIDPRRRMSAASDLVQVTVLAPDTVTADVYAKTLLIRGSQEGARWMRENKPELGYILVTQSETIIFGGNLADYCTEWEEVKE